MSVDKTWIGECPNHGFTDHTNVKFPERAECAECGEPLLRAKFVDRSVVEEIIEEWRSHNLAVRSVGRCHSTCYPRAMTTCRGRMSPFVPTVKSNTSSSDETAV